MVPSLLSLLTAVEDFSLMLTAGKMVKLLEINLSVLWEPFYDRVSLEFLTLRVDCTEPLAMYQFQFGFVHPGTGFWWFSFVSLCFGKIGKPG